MKFLKSIPKQKLQKIVLAAIVFLVGAGAMANFWIAHEITALKESRQKTDTLKTQIELAQVSVKQEVSNTALRDQIKSFVENQQSRMILGDPFAWLVREISLLAEKHPVRVLGMRPGTKIPNAQKPRYEMFTTTIEVEGTYDQIGVFIRELENHFATSQIRSLELTGGDPSRPQCHATLMLAILMQPADAGKPAPKPAGEKKA